MDLYVENILDHNKHPHHYGPLKMPSLSAKDSNPLCGDKIQMDLRMQNGRIAEIGFVSEGCAISKASASMLTDLALEKTPHELFAMEYDDIVEMLGIQLSSARVKCALLGLAVLKKALLLGKFPELNTMNV